MIDLALCEDVSEISLVFQAEVERTEFQRELSPVLHPLPDLVTQSGMWILHLCGCHVLAFW
jgi:hypothetical protein